jgi:hypothetical protein
MAESSSVVEVPCSSNFFASHDVGRRTQIITIHTQKIPLSEVPPMLSSNPASDTEMEFQNLLSCAICLEEFSHKEDQSACYLKLFTSPGSHSMRGCSLNPKSPHLVHRECIEQWWFGDSTGERNTCPLCRTEIFEIEGGAPIWDSNFHLNRERGEYVDRPIMFDPEEYASRFDEDEDTEEEDEGADMIVRDPYQQEHEERFLRYTREIDALERTYLNLVNRNSWIPDLREPDLLLIRSLFHRTRAMQHWFVLLHRLLSISYEGHGRRSGLLILDHVFQPRRRLDYLKFLLSSSISRIISHFESPEGLGTFPQLEEELDMVEGEDSSKVEESEPNPQEENEAAEIASFSERDENSDGYSVATNTTTQYAVQLIEMEIQQFNRSRSYHSEYLTTYQDSRYLRGPHDLTSWNLARFQSELDYDDDIWMQLENTYRQLRPEAS